MEVVTKGDVPDRPAVRRPEHLHALVPLKVYTTGAAAKACGISQQSVIRCFDNGLLAGFKVPGSKFRRILRPSLLAFMLTNGIPLDGLGELTPEEVAAVEAAKGAAVVGPLKLTTADRLAGVA